MDTKQPVVGFIGQGFIGKNYADDFERRGYSIVRYALEEPYLRNRDLLLTCDVVLIAVPTPTTPNGFDDSILRNVIPLTAPGTIVVIKSTVLPGSTERIQAEFPDRYVVYSPEFLTEVNAAHDAAHPFMNIVGIPKDTFAYRAIAAELLDIFPRSSYQNVCHSTEAEFIKYTHNTLGYIKIVWVNMLYDAIRTYGKSWAVVKEAMEHDPMISNWYNEPIHKSGRGAGGACFIKDYAAFRELYKNIVPRDLKGHAMLDAIEQKNLELLVQTGKDRILLEGVYGSALPQRQEKNLPPQQPLPPTQRYRGFGSIDPSQGSDHGA